jgi:hypothetical protein
MSYEWFRGPDRNSIVHDLKINTNWFAKPPAEIWRWSIGRGCSTFTVHGNLLYPMEQSVKYGTMVHRYGSKAIKSASMIPMQVWVQGQHRLLPATVFINFDISNGIPRWFGPDGGSGFRNRLNKCKR